MTQPLDPCSDILEMRDVIERRDALQTEREELDEAINDAREELDDADDTDHEAVASAEAQLEEAQGALASWVADYASEHEMLIKLVDDVGDDEDLVLISENRITGYLIEQIQEMYAHVIRQLPAVLESAIDWERAAGDDQHDYTVVEVDGIRFYYM